MYSFSYPKNSMNVLSLVSVCGNSENKDGDLYRSPRDVDRDRDRDRIPSSPSSGLASPDVNNPYAKKVNREPRASSRNRANNDKLYSPGSDVQASPKNPTQSQSRFPSLPSNSPRVESDNDLTPRAGNGANQNDNGYGQGRQRGLFPDDRHGDGVADRDRDRDRGQSKQSERYSDYERRDRSRPNSGQDRDRERDNPYSGMDRSRDRDRDRPDSGQESKDRITPRGVPRREKYNGELSLSLAGLASAEGNAFSDRSERNSDRSDRTASSRRMSPRESADAMPMTARSGQGTPQSKSQSVLQGLPSLLSHSQAVRRRDSHANPVDDSQSMGGAAQVLPEIPKEKRSDEWECAKCGKTNPEDPDLHYCNHCATIRAPIGTRGKGAAEIRSHAGGRDGYVSKKISAIKDEKRLTSHAGGMSSSGSGSLSGGLSTPRTSTPQQSSSGSEKWECKKCHRMNEEEPGVNYCSQCATIRGATGSRGGSAGVPARSSFMR